VAKVQNCAAYSAGSDKIANQECEAVNFLAKNPQIRPQFNIDKNDPMFSTAKAIGNNAESIFESYGLGTGSSTQCTTRTETTPAQYTTETCSSLKEVGTEQCTMGRIVNIDADSNFQCEQTVNAYETVTCRRGYSPTFGLQVSTSSYTPSFGSQVPVWSSKTFNTTITIDQGATSISAVLSRYQVDNYGQLWINGVRVYQNVLSTFPADLRNSSYGCIAYDEYSSECGLIFNGKVYSMWDDGCNSGCQGVSPNINVSNYLHTGKNTITLVCVNAKSIGPCYATIDVTAQKAVLNGAIVVNGCADLEARSE
jgi:hypothetical protein